MKHTLHMIVICLFVLSFYGCKSNDGKEAEFYIDNFIKNENLYDSLATHLITRYGQDEKYKNEIRVVLLNPSKTKKTLPQEIIDTTIQNWLNKADISNVNLENEDRFCSSGLNFDKIYFQVHRNNYYPMVEYIYSVCLLDSINYTSQTITRRTIKPHWDFLIDNSFP